MYKFFKWLVALFLIVFGVGLVLRNLDMISSEIFDDLWASWPLIIVVFGLIGIVHAFRPEKNGSWQLGSFLVIFGSLLWAGNYQLIEFEFSDIWQLWPLIIVYIGASLLFGNSGTTVEINVPSSKKNNNNPYNTYSNTSSSKEENDENASASQQQTKKSFTFKYAPKQKQVIADRNFASDNWEVQSMNLWTGVGDLYFDFSKAYIPDEESTIVLKGYVADIQMRIPDNIPVKIYSKVSIGEVQVGEESQSGFNNAVRYETSDYKESTRKINLIMNYQVGDITVVFV